MLSGNCTCSTKTFLHAWKSASTINLQSSPTAHHISCHELAGLDPQNGSLVPSIRGSCVPCGRHAGTVSRGPGIKCTKTLDQCPVLYSRALGRDFHILPGTLGSHFHLRFNMSHKNINGRDFCLES